MAGKTVGEKVTTRPAQAFERDGKSFVRFFPVGGPAEGVECEVFGPKEFEAEKGLTFAEFCDSLMEVPLEEADQVGKVRK